MKFLLRQLCPMSLIVIPLAFLVSGCQRGSETFMPMRPQRSWTYLVRNAKQSTVETMQVVRVDSVAHQSGFLLQGGGSETRLAWSKGILLAQELTNTWYSPPMPILDTRTKKSILAWQGKIKSPLFEIDARASITTKPEILNVGGKRIPTLHSQITINVPSAHQLVTISTWFESRIGIVRQEERVNSIQTSAVELLSGPT